MKRYLVISLLLCAMPVLAIAQDDTFPRFTYGAEWGYIAVFNSGYHYNFFAPEGFRLDPKSNEFRHASNAEAYLHAGYNLSSRWNLSIYAGLSGVEKYHLTLPVSIRGTRYFGDSHLKDRWFTFLDLGSGICVKKKPQEILTGKIGGGYRISLSRNAKLDFIVTARTTLTHPDIDYYGIPIPPERINRNNAYVSAISFGMSITF